MKNNRGSMTVELSLIFPFILLTILAIIYIIILLYQVAHLQSLVNHTAEGAGKNWGRIEANGDLTTLMKTGEVKLEDYREPLYWRLTLLDKKTMKERKVEEYFQGRIDEKSAIKSKASHVNVAYRDYILYREVTVDAAISYEIPLPLLKQIVGMGTGYTVRVSSKSIIKDHAEVIRNIDLVKDLMDETEITKSIKDKYNEILSGVKENISEFFD